MTTSIVTYGLLMVNNSVGGEGNQPSLNRADTEKSAVNIRKMHNMKKALVGVAL